MSSIRVTNQDFHVEELLGFSPTGWGTHAWLYLENSGDNTVWIAQTVAKLAGIKPSEVSYSGLKDRHAVTRQWFSINLVNRPMPDWRQLPTSIRPLCVTRSGRKLRRGVHRANRFEITLRDLRGDLADLQSRLDAIARRGVPNYFGEQRFGRRGSNLSLGDRWARRELRIKDSHRRGLAISALRSYLFNASLASRVQNDTWDKVLVGDKCTGRGLPTGPLVGEGRPLNEGLPRAIEAQEERCCAVWTQALVDARLRYERRALVIKPGYFSYSLNERALTLRFTLDRGEFATAVLRELSDYTDVSRSG